MPHENKITRILICRESAQQQAEQPRFNSKQCRTFPFSTVPSLAVPVGKVA
jgi:hypothetical protein